MIMCSWCRCEMRPSCERGQRAVPVRQIPTIMAVGPRAADIGLDHAELLCWPRPAHLTPSGRCRQHGSTIARAATPTCGAPMIGVLLWSSCGLLPNRVRPRLRPHQVCLGEPRSAVQSHVSGPKWIIGRVRTHFAAARRGPKRHAFTACAVAEVLDAELRSGSRLTRAVVVLLWSKVARDHGLPGCRRSWLGLRCGFGLTRAVVVLLGSKVARVHRLACCRRSRCGTSLWVRANAWSSHRLLQNRVRPRLTHRLWPRRTAFGV
jgi:hypothetical protein